MRASLADIPLRRNRLEKVLWSLVECGIIYVLVWVSAITCPALTRKFVLPCSQADGYIFVTGLPDLLFPAHRCFILPGERRSLHLRSHQHVGSTSRCAYFHITPLHYIDTKVPRLSCQWQTGILNHYIRGLLIGPLPDHRNHHHPQRCLRPRFRSNLPKHQYCSQLFTTLREQPT